MADADGPRERLTREPGFEIPQLALGSPAVEPSAFQSSDAGGIIAPIFEPLERVH
jgi:hypothetical protein